jgi:integrase
MAHWDATRSAWRIVATAPSRPGEKTRRRRIVRLVHEPNTPDGEILAAEAEAVLREEIAGDLPPGRGGRKPKSRTYLLGAFAAEWRDRNITRGKWAPSTVSTVDRALAHILPTLGRRRLDHIGPEDIERLYDRWEVAPVTARRWHGVLRKLLADAERLGYVERSPMVRVEAPGGPAPKRPVLPHPDDLRQAIECAQSPMGGTFIAVAAATGNRRGALVALRWRDIDLDTGTVRFVNSISRGPAGDIERDTTKGLRAWPVRIEGAAIEALRAQYTRAKETALGLGISAALDDLFVFSDDGGRSHWTPSSASRVWRVAKERAGLHPGLRLHDLRHLAATAMLRAGIPVGAVADRLGCTEANIQRTYSHSIPSAGDDEAARIMAVFLG